jgi:anti-sigma factor RsiW
MNCAFDKEKLTGYYDGELEAAEKAEVERHIASCSECLRELGELKSAAILVKDLPRLRAPKSIAEGVSREIQSAGKVHQFARVRRTVLWASAAAAALFIGLNVMYFSSAAKPREAPVAMSAPPPAPIAKVQQDFKHEESKQAGEKDSENGVRRLAQDRAAADESKNRELRKSVEEQKDQFRGRDDVRRALPQAAPVERAVEKEKSGALAGGKTPEPKPAAAAEPPAPAKPTAAPPPGAAPAPVAKAPTAPPPAPAAELAEKGAAKENLARAESKKALDPEAPATHLTLASTQVSRSRSEVESALKKMGVPVPSAAPAVKSMKAAPTPDPVIVLELTDSQIARLQQELNKPGASKVIPGAPGDAVVLAEFRDGRMFGKKEAAAGVASGGAGAAKTKDLGKADAKAEPAKDAKESKEADALTRGVAEGQPADKSTEPRRKVLLHLVEVLYVPDAQSAPDALKK